MTQDDLSDGGSTHFTHVISYLKSNQPNIRIEVLIPDFKGNVEHINRVLAAQAQGMYELASQSLPQSFKHNPFLESISPQISTTYTPGYRNY